jgi:hypothetical protein
MTLGETTMSMTYQQQYVLDGAAALRATGTYQDRLIYERGGWYFTSRNLQWDSALTYV